MSRSDQILNGLNGYNHPATFEGQTGFWCQGDCILIQADTPHQAIDRYRQRISEAKIAISHNFGTSGIRLAEANCIASSIAKIDAALAKKPLPGIESVLACMRQKYSDLLKANPDSYHERLGLILDFVTDYDAGAIVPTAKPDGNPCAWCDREHGITRPAGTSHGVCKRHFSEVVGSVVNAE
jgi:hypothetical protein